MASEISPFFERPPPPDGSAPPLDLFRMMSKSSARPAPARPAVPSPATPATTTTSTPLDRADQRRPSQCFGKSSVDPGASLLSAENKVTDGDPGTLLGGSGGTLRTPIASPTTASIAPFSDLSAGSAFADFNVFSFDSGDSVQRPTSRRQNDRYRKHSRSIQECTVAQDDTPASKRTNTSRHSRNSFEETTLVEDTTPSTPPITKIKPDVDIKPMLNMLKFPTNMNQFQALSTGSPLLALPVNLTPAVTAPTAGPALRQETPPVVVGQSMDPILNALNILQHEKSKLERELAFSNDTLTSTRQELKSTKTSLSQLKERCRKLKDTMSEVDANRGLLRSGMDDCCAKIEVVKLGILELRGDVSLVHNNMQRGFSSNERFSGQLSDIDKEINNRVMAYKLLQSKFDEKSGLLLEERNKVMALEEQIQHLSSVNESFATTYAGESTTLLKLIEEKVLAVYNHLNKVNAAINENAERHKSAVDNVVAISTDIRDRIATRGSILDDVATSVSHTRQFLGNALEAVQTMFKSEVAEVMAQLSKFKADNDHLQAEVVQLSTMLGEKELVISSKNTKLDDADAKIQELAAKMETMVDRSVADVLTQQCSNVTHTIEELSRDKIRLESEIETSKSLAAELEFKLQDVTRKFGEKEKLESEIQASALKQFEAQCAQHELRAKELAMSYDLDKKNAVHSLKSKYDKQIIELQRALDDEMQRHVQDMEAERELRARDEESLRAVQMAANQTASQLQQKCTEIDHLHSEIISMAAKIKELEECRPVMTMPEILFLPKAIPTAAAAVHTPVHQMQEPFRSLVSSPTAVNDNEFVKDMLSAQGTELFDTDDQTLNTTVPSVISSVFADDGRAFSGPINAVVTSTSLELLEPPQRLTSPKAGPPRPIHTSPVASIPRPKKGARVRTAKPHAAPKSTAVKAAAKRGSAATKRRVNTAENQIAPKLTRARSITAEVGDRVRTPPPPQTIVNIV
ncbi:uncharacterized protein V1518DRAFT_412860 [Limtongia smithiae]|uniref:uncharacterized protein n=1 Tax=Limtongia smithiae TaxID=1125753 RepID=UPI0034CF845B